MFDSELSIRAAGPTSWATTHDLAWTGRHETFVVPVGFVTDFATVPRFLHWLILPYGAYTRAAVLHDYLLNLLADADGRAAWRAGRPSPYAYESKPITSRDCDGIFRAAMRDLGVPWAKRWTMWAAVRAASCFSRRRAYGRDFHKDAPRVLGMALLAGNALQLTAGLLLGLDARWIAALMLLTGPVMPGAVGVLLSLGWVRVITLLSGGAPPAQTPVGVVPPGQG